MRKGYFTPPVLIILAIIIFAVAILIAINTDLVKRIKKEPIPAPSPSPTTQQSSPAPDETANWETYQNQEFNYLIKYPPTMEPKKESIEQNQPISNDFQGKVIDILTLDLIPNSTSDFDRVKALDFDMQIWVVTGTDRDLKAYVEKFAKTAYGNNATIEPINVSSSSGYKVSIPIVFATNVFLPTKTLGTTIVISERRRVSGKPEEYLQLFNQIISTFQFTD